MVNKPVMQRFPVVYQWYFLGIHTPLKARVQTRQVEYFMLYYDEEVLHIYFIPCQRK